MSSATLAIVVVVCAALAFAAAWFFATRGQRARERDAAAEAQKLVEAARSEADTLKRDAAIRICRDPLGAGPAEIR